MARFIAGRLASSLVVIFAICTIAFFLMRAAPGGPFDEERALPEAVRKAVEARYHLDEPLWKQYGRYVAGLASGDLGPCYRYPDRTVNEVIGQALPVSLAIGLLAVLVAILFGIAAGLGAAVMHNRAGDRLLVGVSVLGVSIPKIVLAPLLVWVFCLKLGWFRIGGGGGKEMLLPALALAGASVAWITRLTRSGVLEVIRKDFVRTARAKGLPEGAVLLKHVLRPALGPVVSYLGPACAAVITGSVVIEKVFNIPGMGRYFVTSAFNRDYTLALGLLLVYSSFLVIFNLAADIGLAFVDPRVRFLRRHG